MNKELKNIDEKVIKMKLQAVQEINFKDMTDAEKVIYEEKYNKTIELRDKLQEEFNNKIKNFTSD